MTVLLGINSAFFLILAVIWTKKSLLNLMIKIMLFGATGANIVQFMTAMGYMVRR